MSTNGSTALWWILFLTAAPLGIWALCRNRHSGETRQLPSETALEILGRRYAAGEISSEEYDERRARLEGRLVIDVQPASTVGDAQTE